MPRRPSKRAIDKRIDATLRLLVLLGLPREQQNERSALTLLGLLDLAPTAPWSAAKNPSMGVTPLMDFMRSEYGKSYAPNTRETIRRHSLHQFVQAGIAVKNPDDPQRPINSPNNVYQIPTELLGVIQRYESIEWEHAYAQWSTKRQSLAEKYAAERDQAMIPLKALEHEDVHLTPGNHSELIRRIIDEFCPRFTPAGRLLYVGDTGKKWAYIDEVTCAQLAISFDEHGKMPDVLVHFDNRGWLVVVEAVTSHGPINPKRKLELEQLFAQQADKLVLVTAFPNRKLFVKYAPEIAWETDVWIAEQPSHMIHFNGRRFLGPY